LIPPTSPGLAHYYSRDMPTEVVGLTLSSLMDRAYPHFSDLFSTHAPRLCRTSSIDTTGIVTISIPPDPPTPAVSAPLRGILRLGPRPEAPRAAYGSECGGEVGDDGAPKRVKKRVSWYDLSPGAGEAPHPRNRGCSWPRARSSPSLAKSSDSAAAAAAAAATSLAHTTEHHANQDQFSTLPEELLLEIVRWLDPESLSRFACVCKRFYLVRFLAQDAGSANMWDMDS